MNAPVRLQQIAAATYGDTDMVRGELYDALNLMRLRVEAAMNGIEAGDDFATVRSMRHLAIHLQHGLGLLTQIEDEKARDRERREQARQRNARERMPA